MRLSYGSVCRKLQDKLQELNQTDRVRYPALDYLRGLMALAVLAFHYNKWIVGFWDGSSLIGRLGVYAVSVFFMLSGLTLTLVYETRLEPKPNSWLHFFSKRIFRIFPLLWLATLATLLLDNGERPLSVLILNLSGVFGFINPAKDIATGAWSIGCELVFYAAFPFLLYLARQSGRVFLALFLLLFGFGAWAAFAWFSIQYTDQASWWTAYVQSGYHAFFFVGGMLLAVFRHSLVRAPRLFWLILVLGTGLGFCYWPIDAAPFFLVSGWNRVLLSALVLLFVTGYFQAQIQLRGWAQGVFAWLGAISYSLYLLHPLVFRLVKFVALKFQLDQNYWALFLPSLLLSLLLSHLSYFYLEKPIMRIIR